MRQHGLTRNGELIVLQRFHGGVRVEAPRGDGPRLEVAVVDVETTGLEPGRDRLIELAAARVSVERESGLVVAHHGTQSWLEDPGRPLSPEIVKLTGITDADLAGHRIPDDEVRALLDGVDLIIAHNARFDRAMCVARFAWLAGDAAPPWGCSVDQIDWRGYGHRHADLGSLGKDHGFFYDAHRATIDVEALIKLLGMRPDVADAPTYMAELLADAARDWWALAAAGTPYDARHDLRARGYRWDADAKHWHTRVAAELLEVEVDWVRELCAQYGSGRPLVAPVPFRARFDASFAPAWEAR